jgi:DNA-binding transcriptional LysR family regulator
MTIEFRHLRAFLAVADEGQVTRAATRLHRTQPSVTRMLNQLEAELGVVLLHRTTRHVSLTAAGAHFRDELLEILPRLDSALRAHKQHARLRLGFAWGLPAGWGQHVIARFESQWGVRVDLVRRDERMAGVDRGEVDVAVLRRPVPPGGTATVPQLPGLHTISLLQETRVAAVARTSALAERTYLEWHELGAWPLVVNVVSGTTQPDHWPAQERPEVAAECQNFDEWIEAVAVNRGLGVLPESVARQYSHSSVRFLPIRGAPPIHVLLAYPVKGCHPWVERFAAIACEIPLEPWLSTLPGGAFTAGEQYKGGSEDAGDGVSQQDDV